MENNATGSKLTAKKKLLFTVFSLLIFAILLITISEIILRCKGVEPWQTFRLDIKVNPKGHLFVGSPALGYINAPGVFNITLADGYSFKVTNLPNTHRITHPLNTYGAKRTKGEIWIFGCSFTYGWSLNDQETFPWLLQERFPEYEMVNFGVDGYGTVQSLIQLREALAGGRVPKAIILNFASWHDERNIFSRNWQRTIIALKNFGQLFYPYARLGRDGKLNYYLGEVNYHPFPLMGYSALMNFIEQSYDKLEERYYCITDVTKALLLEFAHTAQKEHIPVVIAGITHSKGTRKMLSYVRENGFKAVDISVDLSIKENTNYPHDGHPGPLANRKYADKLGAFLRANVLK
jgi:hypothetical protein